MYILQVSDLHVSSEEELEPLREKVKRLGLALHKCIPTESKLLCCLLGDFVDKGDASKYQIVAELLKELSNELYKITSSTNIALAIIPGNHDLCLDHATGKKTLTAFNQFASCVAEKRISFSDEYSIYEADCFGYHLINISTVLNEEHTYGRIDYSLLDSCNFTTNTIVMTHHSLVSGDSNDNAVIRNGYELQKYLEEKDVVALLHGHTHGCKRYMISSLASIHDPSVPLRLNSC